jgi:hypothetical protein
MISSVTELYHCEQYLSSICKDLNLNEKAGKTTLPAEGCVRHAFAGQCLANRIRELHEVGVICPCPPQCGGGPLSAIASES